MSPGPSEGRVSWKEAKAIADRIRRQERAAFRVVSGSMEPVIMTGSMIEVVPLDSIHGLKRFDIILFWNGRLLICHYFWRLNSIPGPDGSQILVTRPLATAREDLPTPDRHVLGKIVSHRIPRWTKLRIVCRMILRKR